MFQFDKVLPVPLKEQTLGDSQVWQRQLDIMVPKRYFVSAPSGKGKTTMQLIMYGIRKDYEGTVWIEDQGEKKAIQTLSLTDWARIRAKRLAIIFQDLRLFPMLTAWENLLLKNQLTNHKTEVELEEMAELLEVSQFLGQKAGTLSYGQRQRVAIIRALCQPFELLLMDEPFAHLDQANIKRCCRLIETVCKEQQAGFMIASLGASYHLSYDETIEL